MEWDIVIVWGSPYAVCMLYITVSILYKTVLYGVYSRGQYVVFWILWDEAYESRTTRESLFYLSLRAFGIALVLQCSWVYALVGGATRHTVVVLSFRLSVATIARHSLKTKCWNVQQKLKSRISSLQGSHPCNALVREFRTISKFFKGL